MIVTTLDSITGMKYEVVDFVYAYSLTQLKNKATEMGADAIVCTRCTPRQSSNGEGANIFYYGTAVKAIRSLNE